MLTYSSMFINDWTISGTVSSDNVFNLNSSAFSIEIKDFSENYINRNNFQDTLSAYCLDNAPSLLISNNTEKYEDLECYVCNGKYPICYNCNGLGYINGNICSICNGTGNIPSANNYKTIIPCTACNETGKEICSYCSGTKMLYNVTCNKCNGTGEININCSTCTGIGWILENITSTATNMSFDTTFDIHFLPYFSSGDWIQDIGYNNLSSYYLNWVIFTNSNIYLITSADTSQGIEYNLTSINTLAALNTNLSASWVCSSCSGTGYATENNIKETFECPTCNGKKTIDISCNYCSGTGYYINTCPECDGKKYITCTACDGDGKIKTVCNEQENIKNIEIYSNISEYNNSDDKSLVKNGFQFWLTNNAKQLNYRIVARGKSSLNSIGYEHSPGYVGFNFGTIIIQQNINDSIIINFNILPKIITGNIYKEIPDNEDNILKNEDTRVDYHFNSSGYYKNHINVNNTPYTNSAFIETIWNTKSNNYITSTEFSQTSEISPLYCVENSAYISKYLKENETEDLLNPGTYSARNLQFSNIISQIKINNSSYNDIPYTEESKGYITTNLFSCDNDNISEDLYCTIYKQTLSADTNNIAKKQLYFSVEI